MTKQMVMVFRLVAKVEFQFWYDREERGKLE